MESTKELYIDDQFQRPNDKCKWISGWIEKKCADEHLIEIEQKKHKWIKEIGSKQQGYGSEGGLWRVVRKGENIHGEQLYYAWYWESEGNTEVKTTETLYEDGSLREIIRTKNNKLEGRNEEFSQGGRLWRRDHYKNGILEGKSVRWYPNGVKQSVHLYKYGLLDGRGKEWYENGTKKASFTVKRGKYEGQVCFWYPNGQLRILRNYLNGEPHGEFKTWDTKGNLLENLFYEEGKRKRK